MTGDVDIKICAAISVDLFAVLNKWQQATPIEVMMVLARVTAACIQKTDAYHDGHRDELIKGSATMLTEALEALEETADG